MLSRIWKLALAWVAIVAIALQAAVSPTLAQEILPHPDKPFAGKIGLTYKTFEHPVPHHGAVLPHPRRPAHRAQPQLPR